MLKYPFEINKHRGTFIKRKNRFVLSAKINTEIKDCYLPNPGRLWELLIPNKTELILVENSKNQKLPFTVLGCKKNENVILLHTHLTNRVISELIKNKAFPIYKEYKVIKEEIKVGNSRFDLLLSDGQKELYLEIKTCTLFGEKIAMFPDAITERGRRHLYELGELSKKGLKASVLFVIMNPQIKYFLPAYHIDFEFAKVFMEVKDKVEIRAIAVGWDKTLSHLNTLKEVSIPYDFIDSQLKDRGVYLLVIYLPQDKKIKIGNLEEIYFKEGYYVYIGSAKRGLSKRIERHKRKSKKLHWHIDYFLQKAKILNDIPIITNFKRECFLVEKILQISDNFIQKFGSSDCSCISHLFYFKYNPLTNENFIDTINYYRIELLSI
jgi:sugar fermentation stimulation protein A